LLKEQQGIATDHQAVGALLTGEAGGGKLRIAAGDLDPQEIVL